MQSIHWFTPHANIVTDESGWSPSYDTARYACGWSPPNYPVPATVYEHELYSDSVALLSEGLTVAYWRNY